LREAVLQEPLIHPRETLIRWAEDRVEHLVSSQRDSGVLVDRGRFDALLVDAASAAGVAVFQPARIRTSAMIDGFWQLDLTIRGQSRPIGADFVVDAAGRNGWLPGKRKRVSPHTTALCGYVPAQFCPRATLVEATFDGWNWGAPIPGRLFSAMVFLDSRTLRNLRPESVEAIWRSRLARGGLFRGVSELPAVSPVIACDATTYCTLEPVGSCFVKVGEASFSLDPLSSTGVEKAMCSGLTAATALHTIIRWPGRRDLCTRYFLNRQTECVSSQAAWSSGFYGNVKRFAAFPFWRVRSAGTSSEPAATQLRPAVRQAKVNPACKVRISESVCLTNEPCIVDDEIRACAVLSHPNLDRPVAFVDSIEVSRLLEIIPYCANLGSLLALWSLRFNLQNSQRIAAWLLDKDILEEVP
jgi:hypothetical protein